MRTFDIINSWAFQAYQLYYGIFDDVKNSSIIDIKSLFLYTMLRYFGENPSDIPSFSNTKYWSKIYRHVLKNGVGSLPEHLSLKGILFKIFIGSKAWKVYLSSVIFELGKWSAVNQRCIINAVPDLGTILKN